MQVIDYKGNGAHYVVQIRDASMISDSASETIAKLQHDFTSCKQNYCKHFHGCENQSKCSGQQMLYSYASSIWLPQQT